MNLLWALRQEAVDHQRAYLAHLQHCRTCRVKWHVRQFIPLTILGVLPESMRRLVA